MKWHKVTAQIEFYTQLDPNTDGPVIEVLAGRKQVDSETAWEILSEIVSSDDWRGLSIKGSLSEETPEGFEQP